MTLRWVENKYITRSECNSYHTPWEAEIGNDSVYKRILMSMNVNLSIISSEVLVFMTG